MTIRTSERGNVSVDDQSFTIPRFKCVCTERYARAGAVLPSRARVSSSPHSLIEHCCMRNAACRHLLVVFGGVAGLEASVDADEALTISGEDASCLFDMWVNTCPAQGSGTIRTEV